MNITATQAKAIVFDGYLDEGFSIVSIGDWVSDGKYECSTTIFKYEDRFYSLSVGRTGSPFTDWDYDWEWQDNFTCREVKEVKVVTTKWVNVK